MAQVSFVSRHKVLTGFLGLLVAGCLAIAVAGWQIYSGLSDINRFELDLPSEGDGYQRPAASPDDKDLTLLLVGVDNGQRHDLQDMLASGEWRSGAFRSDTIMVLHLPADRSEAQLVSIPRDSWVPIDGHGTQKVNAAFSYGGPALLTRTVEQVTDVRIDHAMVVDWDGFKGITHTLGGVQVGDRTMGPDEALAYVRERKSLARGDFDRIERQQQFMLGVLRGLRSRDVVANPLKVNQVVGELSDFVSVDSGLTNAEMARIAWSSRRIGPNAIRTATAPNHGSATVQGQSIVRLDVPATRARFHQLVGAGS